MFSGTISDRKDNQHSQFKLTEQPYRNIPFWKSRFYFWLFVAPIAIAIVFNISVTRMVFDQLQLENWFYGIGIHAGALILYIWLLWVPHFLNYLNWHATTETVLIFLRNIALLLIVYVLFPHDIVMKILFPDSGRVQDFQSSYNLIWFLGLLVIGFISIWHYKTTAASEVGLAKLPKQRRKKRKAIWFEGFSILGVLIGFLVIELWVMAYHKTGRLERKPYHFFIEKLDRSQQELLQQENQNPPAFIIPLHVAPIYVEVFYRGISPENPPPETATEHPSPVAKTWYQITAWFAGSLFVALWLFLTAGLGNRVMLPTLISVTFHEMDIEGILFRAPTYLKHLWRAILMKFHFLTIGGGILVSLILLAAVFLIWIPNEAVFEKLFQPDGLVLIIGIFVAWFGQFLFSLLNIDETYGEYFNHYVANHLMQIQGHIVYVGYGNLGKRIVNRDLHYRWQKLQGKKEELKARQNLSSIKNFVKNFRQYIKLKSEVHLNEIISPDLRIEFLYEGAVVVEKSQRDVIYASENELLGRFGVVASLRRTYKSKSPENKIVHAEQRVLVPVILGEAREPFISSRVNLERANLIVSMVSDVRGVQQVFNRAAQAKINAIIAVTGSDQIAYLTYRARSHHIVLVYPKQSQGNTLGYRVWAAIQKGRSLMKNSKSWPNVLIIGNNRANYYLMETLWHLIPEKPQTKKHVFENHFAFLLAKEPVEVYPTAFEACSNEPGSQIFDKKLPFTFTSGGRKVTDPDDQVQQVCIPAREINTADASLIEQSFRYFQPHILIVNDDIPETTASLLSRCVRALERIKNIQGQEFDLPLLLIGASRGDEREQLLLGDASRFYDAICRMHRTSIALDRSYPVHFYYDHYLKRIVGETFVDSLSDTEEMIMAALQCLTDIDRTRAKHKNGGGEKVSKAPQEANSEVDQPTEIEKLDGKFIEISTCFLNYPGVLASYIALLAGLEPQQPESNPKESESNPEKSESTPKNAESNFESSNSESDEYVLSFQYLRNIKLDPEGDGFAISGFAGLISRKNLGLKQLKWLDLSDQDNADRENIEKKNADAESTDMANTDQKNTDQNNARQTNEGQQNNHKHKYICRVFVNDGRKYLEEKVDPLEGYDTDISDFLKKWYASYFDTLEKDEKEKGSGVTAVLKRLTDSDSEEKVEVSTFETALLGQGQTKKEELSTACPGMSSCRIAALQDYIAASNSKRFPQTTHSTNKPADENTEKYRKLWHAKNYFCRAPESISSSSSIEPAYLARIFVCSNAKLERMQASDQRYKHENLAIVLNALLFRKVKAPEMSPAKNWAIHIDYFKDLSCHNRMFSLNRLFGHFVVTDRDEKSKGRSFNLPIQLIRILPVGPENSFKKWFDYAKKLCAFLNCYSANGQHADGNNGTQPYFMYWLDGNAKRYFYDPTADEHDAPTADKNQGSKRKEPSWKEGRSHYPVVIVIKRRPPKPENGSATQATQDASITSGFCEICRLQPKHFDCHRLRQWI